MKFDWYGWFLMSFLTIVILFFWSIPVALEAPLGAALIIWFLASFFTVMLVRCWLVQLGRIEY